MNEDNNNPEDVLDFKTAKRNLAQIIDEIGSEHGHKVIIKNKQTSVVVVNMADYQALQDRLLAMELEKALLETLEAGKRGELYDWDELMTELGIDLSNQVYEKPEGYDQMIPEKYRSAS